ncbi:unnamed protein product [Orchesella dallaii]|uniref:Gustatory receptor n=1 Tax=Orchesella dallaii TaxID=48710 RepID=A0ABP1Q9P9_9HEXA
MSIESPTLKSISAGQNSFNIDPVEVTYKEIEEETKDDLFRHLRGFLIFGKLIGLLPYKGIFGHSSSNLKFRYVSLPSFISYGILVILFINSFFEFLRSVTASKKNAFEVAQSIRFIFYQVWGAVIYLNFLLRSKSFLGIFQAWKSTTVFYSKPDGKLRRDIRLIAIVILLSAILENAVLHILFTVEYANGTNSGKGKKHANKTFGEAYYTGFHKSWANCISYHPVVATIAFIQHKCTMLAWNYIDILIAVLGRALYYKFKIISELAKESLVSRKKSLFSESGGKNEPLDKQGWLQMTKDHHSVCELLNAFENFLSPLLFISYMVNIYYVCMQLVEGLTVETKKHSLFLTIYAPWSFMHLIMRLYILSLSCAKINHYAHEIRDVIQLCPESYYTTNVSRLDKRVTGGRDIGLSGLGCFTVTKPFILTVIGVVFTFEIVLLQVYPNPDHTNNCSPAPAPSG